MKIVFIGTPDFAVPTLEKIYNSNYEIPLVITQPDRKKGRGKKLQAPPVKIFAEELGLTVQQPLRIRDISVIEVLRNINPDVIVVVAYGQIIPKEILNLPQYGCLNVHASLLPKYRGAAPIHYAIINGEEETGITIMQMDEGLDSGDIIAQKSIKINIDETLGDIHDKLSAHGAELMISILKQLPYGLNNVSQEESLVSYAPKIERQTEKINWRKSAFEIHNLIRGLNPWPGAYTELSNESMKVWMSEIVSLNGCESVPGTIMKIDIINGIEVQAGKGIVKLLELQLPGKKRLMVSEFLKGKPLQVGAIFNY